MLCQPGWCKVSQALKNTGSRFMYVHDYLVKKLNITFNGERVHKTLYYLCSSQDRESRKYFYIFQDGIMIVRQRLRLILIFTIMCTQSFNIFGDFVRVSESSSLQKQKATLFWDWSPCKRLWVVILYETWVQNGVELELTQNETFMI
jgi:hypothetical protein